jgi:hypothetical protein
MNSTANGQRRQPVTPHADGTADSDLRWRGRRRRQAGERGDRGRPRKFTDYQLIIVIVVFDRGAQGRGKYQIGKDSIRRILGVNLSTIKRHLRRLFGLGWIFVKRPRISRTYNSPNIYSLTIFAPQLPFLSTKTELPKNSTMPKAKAKRKSYAQLVYEWRGRLMKQKRDAENHPTRTKEERERWEKNQRAKKWRESHPRHDWTGPNPFIGMSFRPTWQPEDIDPARWDKVSDDAAERRALEARLAADLAASTAARLARAAAEAEARSARLAEWQQRDEDFRRRNYGTFERRQKPEPADADLQARIDALNRKLKFHR